MSNHVVRWLEEQRLEFSKPPKKLEKVFIRFGKWTRGVRSLNFYTGERERGLSVYPARLEPDGTVSLIDDPDMSIPVSLNAKGLYGRLAFVVTGKVVAEGSDGEPVLVGVKLLNLPIRFESVPVEAKFGWRF